MSPMSPSTFRRPDEKAVMPSRVPNVTPIQSLAEMVDVTLRIDAALRATFTVSIPDG